MLGERLKILREEKGISQFELADKLGISASSIGMYETNAREPSDEIKTKIADFFGVTTDYLLGLSDTKEPKAMEENSFLYAFQGGYKQLTEANKKVLDGVLQTLLDNQKEEE